MCGALVGVRPLTFPATHPSSVQAIVKDFVTLDFIPEGTDLRPILPVLAKVRQTGSLVDRRCRAYMLIRTACRTHNNSA